jgi:stage II sporulation protein D
MKRSLFAVLLLTACSTPSARPPATTPAATATVAAAPARSANALTPSSTAARAIAEPRIRVGIVSDQPSATFPRIDGGYFIVTDAGTSTLKRGFTVTAPVSNAVVRYGVQVSALSDETSANELAQRVRTETGQRVDVVFDAAAGLRRIIAGDFPSSEAAQPLRSDLVTRNYGKDLLIVRRPSNEPFPRQHRVVDDEGEQYTIAGDSFLIVPATSDTVSIDQKPYRTAARVFINSRGLLNVINELNLEEYLKGVVPAEMGPRIYDELEGLKAQAVAARTYAVRNFGQFRTEGYDICPGPACQAYGGFSAEEKLSSQAVTDTAGMIMTYEGAPIDALFTSTCGGETSDVSTMFPSRNDPYLKRARCVEMEMIRLAGRADSGILNEHQMNARLYAAAAGISEPRTWAAADVKAAVEAALKLVGFAAPAVNAPASSRRGDVLQYLASILSLDRHAMIVTLPEDRQYFFPSSQSEARPYLAAAFLIKYGFLPTQQLDRVDMNAAMPREELYGLLGTWLRKHGALVEATGKIVSINARALVLKAEGKNTTFTLPEAIPVFRRLGDRYQEYASLPVMAGDRAFVQSNARKTPVAVIVQANIDGASFDRTSSFANWTRSYRADDLVTSIARRNSIQQLLGLRAVTIDASQRIAEMEVTAENGRTFIMKGLPIRWSLNVPDNLFVFEKTTDPDGMDRYTFYGKGWGHGIGMCQVGAYGMAFRGYTYDQILKRYYTGIDIVAYGSLPRTSVPSATATR